MRSRWICLSLVLLCVTFALGAQVNEPELRSVGERDIVFESYTGPHNVFDTAEEIVGIGRALLASLAANGTRGDFYGLYSVIRAVDPTDTTRLNADIIVFEKNAGVDHIRNVRWIIAGYLEAAYGYPRDQADLLAVFTTVYNAVYRRAVGELAKKYTPAVMANLTSENAGIALRYSEWPGKTRLVIPVGKALAAPVLGAAAPPVVSTTELTVPKVVEQMRNEPGQGLEERKAMVDLKETEVTRAREQIAAAREATTPAPSPAVSPTAPAATPSPAAVPAATPATATPAAAVTPRPAPAAPAAATQPAAATPQAARTEPAAAQPAAGAPAAIAQAEAAVAAKETEIQRDREAIVADERSRPTAQPAAAAPVSESVLFLASRGSPQGGRLVVIDPTTKAVGASAAGILSADFTFFQDRVAVIQRDGDQARLALLDPRSLAVSARGEDTMSPGGYLLAQAAAIYAPTVQDGSVKLGRYDASLKRTALSAEAVDPATYIRVFGEEVYVGSTAGDILVLSAADLKLRGRLAATGP